MVPTRALSWFGLAVSLGACSVVVGGAVVARGSSAPPASRAPAGATVSHRPLGPCGEGRCEPPPGGCSSDADCLELSHCDGRTGACVADLPTGAAVPADGVHGGTCADATAVCVTRGCNPASGTCGGALGASCAVASECGSGSCASSHCVPARQGCWEDADCAAELHCDRRVLTCVPDLPAGAPLAADGLHEGTCADAVMVCASGFCNRATGTCAASGGEACTAASECTTNTCTSGHCVPSRGGCWVDADCPGARYCDRSILACQLDLAAGLAIPVDGLHDGSCEAAAAVCVSGACTGSTRLCAAAGEAGATADRRHDPAVSSHTSALRSTVHRDEPPTALAAAP